MVARGLALADRRLCATSYIILSSAPVAYGESTSAVCSDVLFLLLWDMSCHWCGDGLRGDSLLVLRVGLTHRLRLSLPAV